MLRYVLTAALCAAAAAPSLAAPITTFPANVTPDWYVGNGQVNGNFVVTQDAAFTGGALELGLRAQERFVGPYTPTSASGLANGLYNVQTGASPAPNPGDYAAWGFDFSVSYAGGISNLSSVALQFERLTPGLTPLADQVVPGSVFVALFGDSNANAHTNFLVQNTFNPGFDFLSGPGTSAYDFNQPGIYRITLTATANDGTSQSNSILVDIGGAPLPSAVPEPATMAVFGALGLVAFGVRRRRQQAVA